MPLSSRLQARQGAAYGTVRAKGQLTFAGRFLPPENNSVGMAFAILRAIIAAGRGQYFPEDGPAGTKVGANALSQSHQRLMVRVIAFQRRSSFETELEADQSRD